MDTLLLLLLCSSLGFSLANDEKPIAVFVLLRSASIDIPAHEVSEQAEKYFYRGRDQLAEENVRLAFRQGEEFRRRYVFSGMLDKRYLPSEVRISTTKKYSQISTALHFSSGVFGRKIDDTPIIPVVEYVQKDVFEKLLNDENAAVCDVFTPALIKAAVVESENPRVRLSEELENCLKAAGRKAYYKAQLISSGVGTMNTTSSILSVGSFFSEISSCFKRCKGEGRRCEPPRKFDAFITDGRPLIVLSHIFSALEVWNDLPPSPCAAFIVEVKPIEPRFEVYFKRDVHSPFEELKSFTWNEWMNFTSIHEDELGSLHLGSTDNLTRILDDDLPLSEPFFHEDTIFILQILTYFAFALVFTTFIRMGITPLLLLIVISTSHAHKILVYNVKFAHSHSNYLGNVADILVEAGHDVTSFIPEVVAKYSDGTKKSKIVRIPSIEEASDQILSVTEGEVDLFSASAVNPIVTMIMSRRFARAFTLTCESTLNSGVVEQLREEKFDVYIVEGMDICGLMLAHLIQPKSMIMASTTMIHGEQHEDLGVPQILSFNPSPNVASHDIHSLWDRMWNFYAEWLIRELLRPSRVSITELFMKRFGPSYPSIREIVSNVTYAFTNSEPLIDFAIPTISRVVHVGGLGAKAPQQLDEHWSEVLSRRDRAVLISFGSLAKSYLLCPEAKRAILKTVSRFPNVTFIWKYERPDDEFARGEATKLDNLVMAKWMPQNDLLAHERLSLFITHGGMGSVQELTLRGVPGIPLVRLEETGQFSDSRSNLRRSAKKRGDDRVQSTGEGEYFILPPRSTVVQVFDKSEIANDEKLSALVKELLEDDQYRQNARRTAEMLASKPFSSKELLLKHVDFAARFGPSRALRPLSIDMDWIEYYNVDALLVVVGMGILIVVGVIALFIIVLKRFIGIRKQKSE